MELSAFAADVAVLNNALVGLHDRLAIWDKYSERAWSCLDEVAGRHEGAFHDWLIQNFADSMTIGIRRLIYPSRHSVCLIELLEKLAQGSGGITLLDALAVWGDRDVHGRSEHQRWLVERFFVDEGEPRVLSESRIRGDIGALRSDPVLERIRRWANKRVAHAEPRTEVHGVAFEDIGVALKAAGDLHYDYSVLITCAGYSRYEPTHAEHWEEVLDRLFAAT